jgi:hypothetical protein
VITELFPSKKFKEELMMNDFNTVKTLMENDELSQYITEDLEDFAEDLPVTYEVWAIGYDANDAITDTEMFIADFVDPDKAIEKAKDVTISDIIHQASEEDAVSVPEDAVTHIVLEVETVVDDEDGTMNVGTIYKRDLWLDGEYGEEEDAPNEDEYSEVVPITNNEYTLLEDGSIEVNCEILKNFNKNDMVQIWFTDENKDYKSILTYKIVAKTTANKYICEFVY